MIFKQFVCTPPGCIKKSLLVMKLTMIILVAGFLQVSLAANGQRVTLKERNTSIEKILKKISIQTGYDIIYNSEIFDAAAPIDISVEKASLQDVMDRCLNGLPLTYVISNKNIVIKEKEKTIVDRVTSVFTSMNVYGRVVDAETGQPLPGATVVVKEERNFTVAGAEGAFYLINVQENATIVFRYTGYKAKEVKAAKDLGLVRMEAEVGKLNEVGVTVNTGYQRIKPEQSTGAVSQLGTKEFESRVSTDFLSGLVNKLPGLMINNDVQFSSSINGATSKNNLFNVRGISTITGNQNPLIVVDGYPTELTLSMINPNEIESVTVLKDAAASTVYGVRASNGVIIIQRKQAVAGKPRFNFRSTFGLTPKDNYSRYRWDPNPVASNIAYNQDAYKNSITIDTWSALNSGANLINNPIYNVLAQQAGNIVTPSQAASKYNEMLGYDNMKDYSRLFLRTAATQTYNLNVSGGSAGALYYITANYTGNRSQQINNNNGQLMLSGRTTLSLSKRLSLELITDYLESRSNNAPVPALSSLYAFERLQDSNGLPLPVSSGSVINPYFNNTIVSQGYQDHLAYPLRDVEEISDKSKNTNNRVTANFRYKLDNGFNFSFGGIYESSQTALRHYASDKSSQARQYVNSYMQVNAPGSFTYNIPIGGYLQQQSFGTTSYTVRGQLNYDKTLGKDHSINGIIGTEIRDVSDQSSSAAYFGYNDETLLQQPVNYSAIANGAGSPRVPKTPLIYSSLFGQQYADNRYVSGFSNIVYSFRNTYSLTASARIDQSNLFGTNPKYKYKPLWSVGAAWNIDREEFMKDLTWLTKLKLRVAQGTNGNVAKMSLPRVIARAILNEYTVPFSAALTRASFANSTLRWEQTKNFNTGIDFSLFQRVNGSIDYYTKKSTDLLSTGRINPSLGSTAYINTASIRNNGIELNLHADWITKPDFNWNTGLIVARNTSKVLEVYQNLEYSPISLNDAGYLVGQPLGSLFAYRSAGLDHTGLPQVQDENGKVYPLSTTDISTLLRSANSGVIRNMGTSIPTVNAGLSNRIDIGRFYFYCMINYYGGFKVLVPRSNPNSLRPLEGTANYWKNPGEEATTDVMSLGGFASNNANLVYNYSDKYVVNGDYLALGDVTASYNFGNIPALTKAGFTQFEVKLQASNLYTVGLNKFNYSMATGSYQKSYLTPTYTIALFTNF